MSQSLLVGDAIQEMHRIYAENIVGGGLHVVLDDGNLEDEFLERYTGHDADYSPAQIAAEERCVALLKAMSMTQRKKAIRTFYAEFRAATRERPS
jgi:hypothetical protein